MVGVIHWKKTCNLWANLVGGGGGRRKQPQRLVLCGPSQAKDSGKGAREANR